MSLLAVTIDTSGALSFPLQHPEPDLSSTTPWGVNAVNLGRRPLELDLLHRMSLGQVVETREEIH